MKEYDINNKNVELALQFGVVVRKTFKCSIVYL